MKHTLIIFIYLINSFIVYSIDKPISFGTRIDGEYSITVGDSVDVVVQVDTAVYSVEPDCEMDCNPDYDIALRIIDKNGKVLYINNNTTQFVNSRLIHINGFGNALAIIYSDGPCYGSNICSCFQLFGFDNLKYLVPITGFIYLDNIEFDIKWFNMISKSAFDIQTPFSQNSEPYLEIKKFKSYYQIQTLHYYPIYFNGFFPVTYNERIFDVFPIKFDKTNFYTIKDIIEEKKIRLYSNPDSASKYNLIQIRNNSIVKFIEGNYNKGEYFMHLRINGFEGYIKWEDIFNLGFDFSD